MIMRSSLRGPPVAETSKHRIGIRWRQGCRDIFQIQFSGSSIFIHFPYQPDAVGVVSRRELPPGVSHTFEVTHAAKAMTRRVKYSHPIDGHTHFSQDGQVRTSIWNQAGRLDASIGHFFSLDIAGIASFRKCKDGLSSKTVASQFSFNSDQPVDPLHFAGFWLRGEPGRRPTGLRNPVLVDQGTGQRFPAMAIAPPQDSPLSGGVLAILARANPKSIKLGENFYILFTGGFAPGLSDINTDSSFLSLQYPVEDISGLPSIDYHRQLSIQT
jgi:hypothetical protein